MRKNWGHINYLMIILSILVLSFFSYPLETAIVQADERENRSVLQGYQSPDGQAPIENSNDELLGMNEDPILINADEIINDQSLFSMFFQLFFALAIIIAMIYLLIRFIGKRSLNYQTHRTLQNIGGVHVGTNRSVQLVRVGNRVLVVGVGESIQLLKEIEDENEVKKILEDYDVKESQQQFSSLFNWVQTKVSNEEKTDVKSNQYFKQLLERQLTDVKNSQKRAHSAIKEKEHHDIN